jgi:hypothetical protein
MEAAKENEEYEKENTGQYRRIFLVPGVWKGQ